MQKRGFEEWGVFPQIPHDYIIATSQLKEKLLKMNPLAQTIFSPFSWFLMFCQLPSNSCPRQSLSCVHLFATPWTAAHQASLSFTTSWSFLKLLSIELVMPSNHLILYHPLLFLPSFFPSIRAFSNVSSLHQVAKILEFQLQHQSFQWIFRVDFLQGWLVWSPCSPRGSQESSSATITAQAWDLIQPQTVAHFKDYLLHILEASPLSFFKWWIFQSASL